MRQSNALELARERGPRKGVPGSKGIGRGNAPRVAGAGHLSRGGRSMRSRSRSERRRASLWPWRRGHERRFTPTFGGKVKSHPRAREKRRSANRAVKRGTHRKAGESRAERSQRESVGARSRREDGIHRSHASRRAPSGQPGEASLGPTDFDHPVTRGRRKEGRTGARRAPAGSNPRCLVHLQSRGCGGAIRWKALRACSLRPLTGSRVWRPGLFGSQRCASQGACTRAAGRYRAETAVPSRRQGASEVGSDRERLLQPEGAGGRRRGRIGGVLQRTTSRQKRIGAGSAEAGDVRKPRPLAPPPRANGWWVTEADSDRKSVV